jgi:proliferating cell nuclear antigen PCNA
MFSCIFSNGATLLRNVIGLISDSQRVPEGSVTLKKEGIFIQTMDATLIAVVDIKILSTATEDYVCDKTHKIGINFATFGNILKCCSITDSLKLSLSESNPNVLSVKIQGSKKASFQMKLLEIDSDIYDFSGKMEHSCCQNINMASFAQYLKNVSTFTEDIIFKKKNGKDDILQLCGKGDAANISIDFPVQTLKTNNNSRRNISVEYHLKYLSWFSEASILHSKGYLGIDPDFPLLLKIENEKVVVQFFLPPKMTINKNYDDDDDDDDQMSE